MKLYATPDGIAVNERDHWFHAREASFDRLFGEDRPLAWLRPRLEPCARVDVAAPLLAPLGRQEVWAAGVTFQRSREARMAESGREADVYDRVYDAERPELFFKATPHRVVGAGGEVRMRRDSAWNVPEAELALAVNRAGRIFGYTIGNDMSSRSIEGENPLYLPQAKIHDGCCALGPCLLLSEQPLAPRNGNLAGHRKGWARGVPWLYAAIADAAQPGRPGRVAVPGQLVSRRLLPADRYRHRT